MRVRCRVARTTSSIRPGTRLLLLALAAAAVILGTGGCYEVAYFYPMGLGGGQGSPVTDGRNLGVASRLTGEEAPTSPGGTQGQAYLVLSVGEAYTADAEDAVKSTVGGARAIIPVTASVVNETDKPVAFETNSTRLEVAGRIFAPKWSYRTPQVAHQGGADSRPKVDEAAFHTVEGGTVARYDMYFDLGTYVRSSRTVAALPGGAGGQSPAGAAVHMKEGLPLGTIRQITITWKASLGGEGDAEGKSGKVTFMRDWSGYYPPVAFGPYWGGGWYVWAAPWRVGGPILMTRSLRYTKPVYKRK